MEITITLSDKGKHTQTKFDFKEIESQDNLGEFFYNILRTLDGNLKKIPDTPKQVFPIPIFNQKDLLNYPEQPERPKEFSWDNPPQPSVPGGERLMTVYRAKPAGDKNLIYRDKHRLVIAEKLEDGNVNILVEYSFPVKKWVIEDDPYREAEINKFVKYYDIPENKIKAFG